MTSNAPLLAVLATVPAAGCTGSDDGSSPPLGAGPLYLAASWVADVDTTNTYIAVVDSLDEDLDFSTALEVPGYGDAWVWEEWVFVADGESPSVSRYSLDEDGALVFDTRISFANYGVPSSAFWNQEFVARNKAYLANDAQLEYVVWDPEAMEITGTVPWPEFPLPEDLAPFQSYTDRGGVVADGHFFHGLYAHDYEWTYFGQSSIVAVYDIATDALVDTIEVPCPMMDVASLADDGYIYVSGWSYMPLSVGAGVSDTNCAARIDVESRTLDPSWSLAYPDVTGDEGSGLRVVTGDDGILAVFHGTDVPVTEGMDIWELDAGENDWEIYDIALSTKTATPTGVKMSDGSYYESHIDDRYFIYLPNGEYTQVYERTEDGWETRFQAAGWMSRLFRVR